MTTLETKPKA